MNVFVTKSACMAIIAFAFAGGLGLAQPPTANLAAPGPRDADIARDLSAEMDRLVAEDRFSGAVSLSRNGQSLLEHAYGLSDRGRNVRNTVDTKFNMASVTKVFTAVAILQLAERGMLSLDETLGRALPDYPNADAARNITIHQLLEHKSGLGDFFGEEYASNPSTYKTLRDYLPLFANKPLLFTPGTKVAYSNAGFIVLGLVIERLSGVSYYDYVRRNIFEPAGMKDTGFWSSDDAVPNVALGYTRLSAGAPPTSSKERTVSILNATRGISAGGSYSTVRDLKRFADRLRTRQLLKADSLQLLFSGGYGVVARSMNNVRYVGHGGGAPGANAYFEMYPEEGYVIVALSNYDPPAAEMLPQRLRQEIAEGTVPTAVHLPDGALERFVGRYVTAPLAVPEGRPGGARPGGGTGGLILIGPGGAIPAERAIEVSVTHEALRVTLGKGDEHAFVPLSTTEFFDRDTLSAVRLTFTIDERGRVTGLAIKGSGMVESTKALRLPSAQMDPSINVPHPNQGHGRNGR